MSRRSLSRRSKELAWRSAPASTALGGPKSPRSFVSSSRALANRSWYTRRKVSRCHGPLRPVVERVLRSFLTCGLAEHGFARAWCQACRLSYLVPYSCHGRSFCPSCEKKRELLWAEWLHTELLSPVPHRTSSSPSPACCARSARQARGQEGDLGRSREEAPRLGRRCGEFGDSRASLFQLRVAGGGRPSREPRGAPQSPP